MTRIGRGILATILTATPTVTFAQLQGTPEQRAACMMDAITLCSAVIPNRARIAMCLGSQMDALSPRCRAQFEKFNHAAKAPRAK